MENLTSGSFTVTFTNGVSGVTLPQGARSVVITDGTNGARIASNTFETGTVMLFAQTSAPVGWTKDTSNYNNYALRIVTGSASTGGSVPFTTAFASQTPAGTVGNTTLTIAQMPLHGHTVRINGAGNSTSDSSGGFDLGTGSTPTNYSAFTGTPTDTRGEQIGGEGGGGSHTHTFTGTALNLAVNFVDCIRATKA